MNNDPKIPSDGPMLAANIEKLRLSGIPMRKAISMAGLMAKGGKK